MAEFPETKLVKLLIIALTEKNTLMKRHCVGQTFIVYCSKETTLQQKSNLFKLFIIDVSWWISLLFLNFIFHQLQITYNSITNFYPAFRTSFRLPSWWCHAFLQERIQKSSPRVRKNASAILKGRAQKRCVSIHSRKKMEVEAKKLKNNDFRCTNTWNKKVSYLCVCCRTHWCDTMSVSVRNCVKDTTLTTLFFIMFYFHWFYYNKYFVRYLQNKSSLVLLTNYSII